MFANKQIFSDFRVIVKPMNHFLVVKEAYKLVQSHIIHVVVAGV